MADARPGAAPLSPPGILTAAWLVARKDLAIEFRTRSAFFAALVFALLGLVIFFFAWDPTAVGVLVELRAAGAALVLVTHNLAEGLALATHAAVMRAGRFARYEARERLEPARYADEYRELVTGGV